MLDTIDIQTQLYQKWMIIFWALSFGACTSLFAWHKGFFKPFSFSQFPVIKGSNVLIGFGLFIFLELVIPSLILTVMNVAEGKQETWANLKENAKLWINSVVILGGFIAFILTYWSLDKEQRQQLFRQTATTWFKNLAIGIAVWFLAFPVILAFSEILSLLVSSIFPHSSVEQVAVQHLRKAANYPGVLAITTIEIVTIVPITEEFLFRGLLQSWLKRIFNNKLLAIGLSASVFAFFHYSTQQGATNIELLPSLFLLGCLLGYLYERQRSLWAAIGLHGFFNLMSILLIFKG